MTALPDERSLRHAVAETPSSSDLLNLVGVALGGRKNAAAAATWFQRLLAVAPGSIDGVVNLTFACMQGRKWEASRRWTRKLIALLPGHPLAHYNDGVASLHLGRFAETARSSARARAIDPTHLDAPYNEALGRLALGEWQKGFSLYERRWEAPSFPIRWRGAPGQRWDGRPAPGKTLLLLAEQGYGDTIQFVRYAQLAAPLVGRVLVACPPTLLRLVAAARGVAQAIDAGTAPTGIDLHLPLLSLPWLFGTKLSSVPALVPYFDLNAARVGEMARAILPSSLPRVGLCWRGNPAFVDDTGRSPGLAVMKGALAVQGIRFVKLVKDDAPGETTRLDLIDPMDRMHDFFDTAHLLASLDLIITSDTAVAHLAGALGRPTWLLLSAAADWRWLTHRAQSPWYPTMALFRQSTLGRWTEVSDRIAEALETWLRNRY